MTSLPPSPDPRRQTVAIHEIASSRILRCAERSEDGGFAAGVFFGDAIGSPDRMREAIARYEDRYGAPPPLVKVFHSLEDDFSANGRAGQVLRALLGSPGVTPLISLEPTWHGSPASGLLDFIASGQADARLTRIARGVAAAGPGPIVIELGAEMNARFDAPWQAARNGDEVAPAAFVRAWQHIVDVMRAGGARHVRWVFAPSAGNPYTHRPTGPEHWAWYGHWYPGPSYVDYMGLHAFNDARAQGAWVPFAELVAGDAADHMLDDMVVRFPGHRTIVGELATSEHPDRRDAKGRWIGEAYRQLRGCSAIAGVIWFDMDKEADWHIDSSQESASAYRAAVSQTNDPRRPVLALVAPEQQ